MELAAVSTAAASWEESSDSVLEPLSDFGDMQTRSE
jgi:hypothetical protein